MMIRRAFFAALCFMLCSAVWCAGPWASDGIKIGAVYAVTGLASKDNRSEREGVRLAVYEINGRGGILGRRIDLRFYDNRSMPVGSKVAAEQAAKGGVTAIVGASWSAHSIAAARVAQRNKIPMMSSFSTSPKVTLIGDYIFRACYIDPFQGMVLARLARKELKAGTAAVFRDITSDFSMGLAAEFISNFKKSGGRVLRVVDYKQKQPRFDSEIMEVIKVRPDVVFLSGHQESGLIAKKAQEMGLKTVFLGGDGWGARSFYKVGGEHVRKGYYCTAWSPSVDSPASRTFLTKYKHLNIREAGVAQGYDAMMLLADAIRRAGTTDRAAVRRALADTDGYEGVTGTFRFNENGDPLKGLVIIEITNGREDYFSVIPPVI